METIEKIFFSTADVKDYCCISGSLLKAICNDFLIEPKRNNKRGDRRYTREQAERIKYIADLNRLSRPELIRKIASIELTRIFK